MLLGIFPDTFQMFSSSLILHLCRAKAKLWMLIRGHSIWWLCFWRQHCVLRKCLGAAFCREYIARLIHFFQSVVKNIPVTWCSARHMFMTQRTTETNVMSQSRICENNSWEIFNYLSLIPWKHQTICSRLDDIICAGLLTSRFWSKLHSAATVSTKAAPRNSGIKKMLYETVLQQWPVSKEGNTTLLLIFSENQWCNLCELHFWTTLS